MKENITYDLVDVAVICSLGVATQSGFEESMLCLAVFNRIYFSEIERFHLVAPHTLKGKSTRLSSRDFRGWLHTHHPLCWRPHSHTHPLAGQQQSTPGIATQRCLLVGAVTDTNSHRNSHAI